MIQKNIHYIWLGDQPTPKEAEYNIQTWKTYMPDYNLVFWNNEKIATIPELVNNEWLQTLLVKKYWTAASDYVRLYAVYTEGGIYFDLDIELYKSIDSIIQKHAVVGFTIPLEAVTCDYGNLMAPDGSLLDRNIICGHSAFSAFCFSAEKGHLFIKACMDFFNMLDKSSTLYLQIQALIINLDTIMLHILGNLFNYKYNLSTQHLINDIYIYANNLIINQGGFSNITKESTCIYHHNWSSKLGRSDNRFVLNNLKARSHKMRFHVLGVQHTATNKAYTNCAFTQKVLNLCKMLKMQGHYVIHYGNELSDVDCDELVIVTHKEDAIDPLLLEQYDTQGPVYFKYNQNAIKEILNRKQKNDFLLCPWLANKPIADFFSRSLITVESGIGYGGGSFAPYRIYESYAIMHANYGNSAVTVADKLSWYHWVIPNYIDPNSFEYSDKKKDYLLFLGMRHGGIGKGYSVAADIAKDTGKELLVAGTQCPTDIDKRPYVKYIGLLGIEERKAYLRDAAAVLCPSLFLEPFCGVQVEAFASGTPVISTDWGAFVEYNKHGITGYRCKTHDQFVKAVKSLDKIKSQDCLTWAKNFYIDNIAKMYDEFWGAVMNIYTGNGWYECDGYQPNFNFTVFK